MFVYNAFVETLELPSNYATGVPADVKPFAYGYYYSSGGNQIKNAIQNLIIRSEGDGIILDNMSNAYDGLGRRVDEVVFQEGVTHIGTPFLSASNHSITGWSLPLQLQKVTLPSTLKSIGDSAFYGQNKLTQIHLPEGLTSIGNLAFSGCAFSDVYYEGTTEGWKLIDIGSQNESLTSATIHFAVNAIPDPDFILPAALTSIEDEAFAGGAFVYVKLPDKAVSIGWHAFADCPNLVYIYIPALTTQIDEEAFGTMQSLTILGKTGTTAETYANDHHYTFIAVS